MQTLVNEDKLPRYQCHKKVRALKITTISMVSDVDRKMLHMDNVAALLIGSGASVSVSDEYMSKHKPDAGGYFVLYEDGYQSFSPAEAFEGGYAPLGRHGTTVTKEQIDKLLETSVFYESKLGAKTCVLTMALPNGFEITESAACVDPANYSRDIGIDICKKRIADRLWQLEGYRLQCALNG